MHILLFNLYSSLALTASIGVIISQNAIHSVIFLILVFINTTGLLLLFKIELLAMMFIIIYIGAIAVLFLFVVMMLNIKINQIDIYINKSLLFQNINNSKYINFILQNPIKNLIIKLIKTPIIISSIIFILITLIISLILNYNNFNLIELKQENIINQIHLIWNNQDILYKSWLLLAIPTTNIQTLGYLIYTYYFYYFIIASLILLISMIGAIVLTMYKRKNAFKKQLIYKQINRSFESAIFFII